MENLKINLWIDSDDQNYIVGEALDKKGVISPNYPIIIEFNRDNENLDCYESRQTYQGTITNLLEQLHISTLSFYDFVLDKVIDFIEQMEVSQ